jgi:poly(glycerol-phosphate) alpha-glucosyltransferase
MLEALIAELGLESRVTLHGYRPDAAEQTATAALLIVSSNYEGQGLVVLEAFSRGCPVVAYDISYGPSEMIEPGVNGELVPAGDIEALGATIGRLIGDAATLERYSEAAYAWAGAHDARRAAEYSAELFRGLLAQPAASTHA